MFRHRNESVRSPYTWIFLIGSTLFLGGWLLLKNGAIHDAFYTGGDAAGYMEAGKYLWLHFKLHYFRTFGFSIFTGLPAGYGASDEVSRYIVVVFNGLLYIGSAFVLYDIMNRIGGSSLSAFILSIIYLFSPGLIFINYATLSEPLFIFTVLIGIRFLVLFQKSKSPSHILAFALFILFSTTVRPINLYFSIFIALVVFIYFIRNKAGIRVVSWLGIGFFIMVILPIISMKYTYGVATYTNNSKYMLYHYTCSYASSIPESNQIYMYDSFHRNAMYVDTLGHGHVNASQVDWVKRDSLYSEGIKRTLKERKKQLFIVALSNFKENSSTPSHAISNSEFKPVFAPLGRLLYSLSKYQNIIYSALALLLCTYFSIIVGLNILRKKAHIGLAYHSFVVLQIAVFIGLSSLSFWQGDRFSIVFYPLVLLLIQVILVKIKGAQKETH